MPAYVAESGMAGYWPDYREYCSSRQEAIEILLQLHDIDENTVIVVDPECVHDTGIIDIETFHERFSSGDTGRFEVTFGKDLIEDLETSGYCDLPIEGIAHPVFGANYLEVYFCEDCDLYPEESE